MKILMIDDQPSRTNLLWKNSLLHRDIVVAHGIDQVNFYLDNFEFNLILLDHDMPLTSGPDICQQCLIHRNIPVIIISNNEPGSIKMMGLLDDYAVPVYYRPITDPRAIVDMINSMDI